MTGVREASVGRLTNARLAGLAARHGSPLLVIDCEAIRGSIAALSAALPGVDLHYALKPLPHAGGGAPCCATLGAGFDLATTGEVELVRAQMGRPERCIHTHPIKRDADIRAALASASARSWPTTRTRSRKFERYRGRAELLLRVSFRNPAAVVRLVAQVRLRARGRATAAANSRASSASRVTGPSLPRRLAGRGPRSIRRGDRDLRELMLAGAAARGLAQLDVLDIGGGFPIPYGGGGEPIARLLSPDPPRWPRCRDLARDRGTGPVHRGPGRHLRHVRDGPSAARGPLVVLPRRRPVWLLQRAAVRSRVVPGRAPRRSGAHATPSVLAGPTCDSIDVIGEDLPLPELGLGDLIVGRMMGAYTCRHRLGLQFLPGATVVAVNQRPGAQRAG